MFFQKSLGGKIILCTILTTIVVAGGTRYLISQQTNHTIDEHAINTANETAERYANDVQRTLTQAFTTSRTLGAALQGAYQAGMRDREVLNTIIREALASNPVLIGAYGAFEPNVLDGRDAEFANTPNYDATGRFVPYWNRGGGEIKREILTDYDKPGAGDYYILPTTRNKEVAIEPYDYVVAGKNVLMSTFAAPMHDAQGKVIGATGVDLPLAGVAKMLEEVKPLDTGRLSLITEAGIWIAHPDPAWIGKNLSETEPEAAQVLKAINDGNHLDYQVVSQALGTDVYRFVIPFKIGNSDENWGLIADIPVATVEQLGDTLNWYDMAGTILLVILLGGILSFATYRMLSVPMGKMNEAVIRINRGDYSFAIPYTDGKDEMGTMARALSKLSEDSAAAEGLRRESEENKQRAEVEKRQMMNTMADNLDQAVNSIISGLSSAITGLQNYANSLEHTASGAKKLADDVAHQSQEAAAGVATVASATEQLTASIREISQQSVNSSKMSQSAVEEVRQTDVTVSSLAQSADKIGEIVSLINEIANQTNLLALNATIEAARAGEAGKGFAVVASEVKNLATQTAKATEDITLQINEVQQVSGRAVDAIKNIGRTIDSISGYSTGIASAVQEQEAATQDIARNIENISGASTEVSSSVVGVVDATRKTGDVAQQIKHAASELTELSDKLKNQVDSFIQRVRQA